MANNHRLRRLYLSGGPRLKLSITLDPDIVRKIDGYSQDLNWTRSGVIELVLEKELEHVIDEALFVLGRQVSNVE